MKATSSRPIRQAPRPWACAALLATLLGLSACGGGGGGDAGSTPVPTPNPTPSPAVDPPGSYTDGQRYASDAAAALSSAVEGAARTEHSLQLNGATLAYTATAGHLTVRSPGGTQDQASMFYVAYTAKGAASTAQRPLTFFYNGGPGSASVWLHLGSFGPKRLDTRAPSTTTPRPFALVDNAESLLDVSDLVFVNAVGSGLSQAIAPFNNQSFWGVDADAALFRDFVQRYIAVSQRQASPKYLFGESYGGPRTAVLASLLEAAGVPLTGLVLQSPAMNYNSNCGIVDIECSGYLPSYAAVGAFHQRAPSASADVAAYMAQMRSFSSSRYAPALASVLQGAAPPSDMPDLLSGYTGLASSLWRSDFNMTPERFSTRLLPSTVIGRYDARMTALLGSPLAGEGDPSSTFISAGFASAIASYLRNELLYRNDSTYVVLSNAIETWNFSHAGKGLPDTIPDLGAALTLNPQLKVLNVNGYHDMATPFYQSERDLARLGMPNRIATRSYPGGHMTYLDDDSRRLQKADLKAFYAGSLTPQAAAAQASTLATPLRRAQALTEQPLLPPTVAPAGSLQTLRRDPWVPPALRASAALTPPSQGQALQREIEARLRAHFMAASGGAAQLSRAQAQRAGLQAVVQSFDTIDAQAQGSIRFEDWLRHLRRTTAAQQ